MMLPAAITPRIGQLILMLSSDADGEVLNAARAIGTTLRKANADWHALAAAITQPPPVKGVGSSEPRRWAELARWCEVRRVSLAPHESKFIADMVGRLWGGGEPTEKQGAWLRSIYAKLRKSEAGDV